jgi:hypothetical protein
MQWVWYVEGMLKIRIECRILIWKPDGRNHYENTGIKVEII